MSQCHAEKLGCYHLGQGHSYTTMNMIVSAIFSELMILLQT